MKSAEVLNIFSRNVHRVNRNLQCNLFVHQYSYNNLNSN